MSGGLVTAAYIVAAILFIFSLAGLSKHETSKQGNTFGVVGMAIALIATIFGPYSSNVGWILTAMVIGGAIGIYLAKKVEMTEMPELVAILHSFVGLAAVLVGFNSYIVGPHLEGVSPEELQVVLNIHHVEVFLGIFIGAVTFTGSVVAFGKLRGTISSKPLMLPHRHKLNLAAIVVSFLLMLMFVNSESVGVQVFAMLIMTVIALAFGWPYGGFYRWCRYAGCGVHAELLLRLGRGGCRFHAEQRPADRHRCAGWFFRCYPVLHHV